jgi:hypothetical protein
MFIGMHLVNHLYGLAGPERHIALMENLRLAYRNPVVETVLLMAAALQVFTGLRLFFQMRKLAGSLIDKLHLWSGLYLATFLLIHVSAVLAGRYVQGLDTNFYFGAAGLNTWPLVLFFGPYYFLGMMAFWVHIACIHAKKAKSRVLGLSPFQQAWLAMGLGLLTSIATLYGLSNGFQGFAIPSDYLLIQ